MLLLISPAKSLDFGKTKKKENSQARFLLESEKLVNNLKRKSIKGIKELMHLSDSLALLNRDRYQTWKLPFDETNAKQAILAFKGEVYLGLEAETFNVSDYKFAQKHLRILSGLYGLLRPLDLMQPYRLEMGTKLKVGRANNLYKFWDEKITNLLNEDLAAQGDDTILNLASNEYFKSIKTPKLNGQLFTANFKEIRNGKPQFISFTAKKARGLMSRFIIKNKIKNIQDVLAFDYDGYKYNPELSKEESFIFTK